MGVNLFWTGVLVGFLLAIAVLILLGCCVGGKK